MRIIHCGNLFLVVDPQLKTVYQTHIKESAENYLNVTTHTLNMNYKLDTSKPVKYHKTIKI